MMAEKRHSTVQFNPTEWLASTARMPRIVRSVYFDLCVYTWEHAAKVPPSEVFLMISDLPEGQGEAIIANLVQGGKLKSEGPAEAALVWSPEALAEAERAAALYEAKSRGGRGRATAAPEEPQEAPSEPERPVETPTPPPTEEEMRQAVAKANDAQDIANCWNRVAVKHGYKQVAKMTNERLSRLHARIAEHGGEAIMRSIEALPRIPKAQKPVFDDLLKPDRCAKLVELACGEAAGELAGEVD
jgi:hypothetical protein